MQSTLKQAALLRAIDHIDHFLLQTIQTTECVSRLKKIDFFIGKIKRSLDKSAQFHKLIKQRSDLPGKTTLQRAYGTACGYRCRRVDEVDHRFGLSQIELAVEKSTAGELPRLGEAGAQIEASGQQHLHDYRPAVPLQLQNIFSGKRMRSREMQQ